MELEQRRGLASAIAAYVFWGLFPLYWPLLKPSSTGEILAHRIIWSLAFVAVALTIRRSWRQAVQPVRSWRTLTLLLLAAISIMVNWGAYIHTVNIGRTIDASLGYFIMPLISVLVGVTFFRERLRPLQWTAVGVAAAGIAVQAVLIGRIPWMALVLAASFGGYGVLKKMANMQAMESMLLETALLTGPALVLIFSMTASGEATFGEVSFPHSALLVIGGVITVAPLILLSKAATSIPLSTLGTVQYATPIMQFLIGWLVQHEQMTAGRWLGFAVVWLSLGILSADVMRQGRRARNAAPSSEASIAPVR